MHVICCNLGRNCKGLGFSIWRNFGDDFEYFECFLFFNSFWDKTETRHGYLGALKRIHMHKEEEGPTTLTKAICFLSLHVFVLFLFLYLSPSFFQCGWVWLGEKNITTFNAPIVRKRRGKELPSLSPWFSSSTSSRNKVGAGGASPLCCSLPSFSWLHTKGVTTTTESNEGKVQIKRRKKGGSWNFELIHHC